MPSNDVIKAGPEKGTGFALQCEKTGREYASEIGYNLSEKNMFDITNKTGFRR
ncbi:MAG: hypothetical protein Kow0089_19020 [Desulfobulbaceae bacterium]